MGLESRSFVVCWLKFLLKCIAKSPSHGVLYAYINKALKVGNNSHMTTHVIELNGQMYDAITGRPVSPTTRTKANRTPKSSSAPKHLDGFRRRPGVVTEAHTTTKPIHHKAQKSQTLMRKTVAKPTPATKIHSKATSPSHPVKPTEQPLRVESIKPGRAIRASHVSQSSLITKFGKTPAPIKSADMPVKPAPAIRQHKATITPTHSPVAAVQAVPNKFQKAIDNAVSHKAPKVKKPRVHHRIAKKLHVSPRIVSFSAMALTVLAVGGILAYQNMPEIAMRIASTRAGLNASLPAYQPAGFSLDGPIKYNSGEITLNYKSNSDDRAFNVVQKNSSWNSETLLDNFVNSNKRPYQTFEANGRTIYIYDGNKATWVDGGIWFNIDGKANLNSDQLLKIADSL